MMKDNIFSKLSKAVDAFTDVLTEDIDSKINIGIYRYEDFVRFFKDSKRKNTSVEKCTIAVEQVDEFDGVTYPEKKFLIRVVLLNKESFPITLNGNEEEYMGCLVIANSIDTRLKEFMGDKKEKTVVWKGGN